MKLVKKFQNPSGSFPSYLFDVTQYKAPEEYTDTIEPAVITAKLPEKFHGSQAAAARYAAGQRWGKENVAEPRDKFAQEYVLPTMEAAAFGIPGLVGVGGGFAVDATINALTNGNKNSFGDLFVDPEKHPILNTAVNFFNPGYYLGGLAVTKPLVQTVSPRTAIALGLEKEYLKNEIKALNRRIKNWNGNNVIAKNILAGKIGWAPKQAVTLWHNSETPISKLETTFPAWDVTTHDAPLGHVWGTSTETRQGFIGARPYHNRTSKPIILEKPMIQLNESIGNGKNAVRNEILKFADQSGADAINFSNIKDNTLQNQDVYAVFKDIDVVPKLAEAERLGIPKGERSNLQALEDPQYWGYKQWNDRYNAAVKAEDWDEVQRLRDLHFKIKAPDTKVVDENRMPLHTYHGLLDRKSSEEAIKFNKYEGVNWDVEDAVEQGSKINHWKLAVPTGDIMSNYHSPNYDMVSKIYALGHKDLIYDDYLNIKNPFTYDRETIHNIVNNFKPGSSTKTLKIEPARYERRPLIGTDGKPIRDSKGRVIWSDPELIPERHYYHYDGVSDWAYFGGSRKPLMQLGYDGLYIPQYYDSYGAFVSPSQFKSAEPITRTDMGKIIPIVKRDNFHNLDRRYKQGGILKAQNGLGKIPIIGPIAKKIAYKVITEPSVAYAGGATPRNFIKSLVNKNEEDDNKKHFLFGVDRPETSDGQAYTWEKDITENGYKNVRSYKGILNPYNEYVFDKRNEGLVKALADKNYTSVVNINDEYTDPETGFIAQNTPYFDDVHGYRIVMHNKSGQPVISASDLYDFGKNYSENFGDVYEERAGTKNGKNTLEIQRRLLNSVGQPYKLVQKDIPIRFTDNPQGSEIYRTNSITNQVLNRLSDKKVADILETGYIEPSIKVE